VKSSKVLICFSGLINVGLRQPCVRVKSFFSWGDCFKKREDFSHDRCRLGVAGAKKKLLLPGERPINRKGSYWRQDRGSQLTQQRLLGKVVDRKRRDNLVRGFRVKGGREGKPSF